MEISLALLGIQYVHACHTNCGSANRTLRLGQDFILQISIWFELVASSPCQSMTSDTSALPIPAVQIDKLSFWSALTPPYRDSYPPEEQLPSRLRRG